MAAQLRRRWAVFRLVIDHYPQTTMYQLLFLMVSPYVLPAAVSAYTSWAAVVVLAGFALVRRRHPPFADCCVARFPRDPVRYMARHASALATVHWMWGGNRLYYAIGGWLVVDVLLILTVPINGFTKVAMPAAILGPLWFALHIAQVHRNIVWFCPICWRNPGDDDDHAPDPDPEPVPSGTKTLQPA